MRQTILLNFVLAFFLALAGSSKLYQLDTEVLGTKNKIIHYKLPVPVQAAKKSEKNHLPNSFYPLTHFSFESISFIPLKKNFYTALSIIRLKLPTISKRQSRAPPFV